MKTTVRFTLVTLAVSCSTSFAALSGSVKLLAPATKKEVNTVRIGRDYLLRLSITDAHLLTNKNVTLTYALSVTPKGSNTPVQVSGKLAGRFVLPASEGGLAKTRQETASWRGTQTEFGLITIPDFMPAGVATLTVTLTGKDVGSIGINKNLTITL